MIPANELYKSLLQKEKTYESLSEFVNQAENFNAKEATYDVVREYLKLSGNCAEIIQLIKDIANLNGQNAVVLFKALCHILIRIASDLCIFVSTGQSIVNEILAHGTRTIFNFLKVGQKASRSKIALHLLASMVSLGKHSAHQVLTQLDFSHSTFSLLINRFNLSEEEDIRTALLNLIVLLMSCDSSAIKKLVEIKGFLNNIMPGLLCDRASTILLVLNAFRIYIVENPDLSKTNKLRLFNDFSLKPVLKLYSWKGPLNHQKELNPQAKSSKRKLGEGAAPLVYEVSEEDAESVHKAAHQFMLSVCCSHKHGIIFYDSSCGTSGRNVNHIITNILKSVEKPYSNALMSEFVVAVLKACPDQLKFYLPCLKDSFQPRLSVPWLQTADLLEKIISSQDLIHCLFKSPEKRTVSSLIQIAKSLCIPAVISASELEEIFEKGNPVLCHHLCKFLLSILKQVEKIVLFCKRVNFSEIPYTPVDLSSFIRSFITAVTQRFSLEKIVQSYIIRLTVAGPSTIAESLDIPIPSLSEKVSVFVGMLKMVQDLFHLCHQKFDSNVPKILAYLKECKDVLLHDELFTAYEKVIDLLIDQGTLAVWNKNPKESTIMNLEIFMSSSKSVMKDGITRIIHKLLLGTRIFDQCSWEVDVWVDALKHAEARNMGFIMEFINEAMCTLLENPNKFIDDIVENTLESSSSALDYGSTKYIDDLLNEDGMDGENPDGVSAQQSFSSFVPAALLTLKSITKRKQMDCLLFMERALSSILHHQHFPNNCFAVINKYKPAVNQKLYAYWSLLCSIKSKIKVEMIDSVCSNSLDEHLKQHFTSWYSDKRPCTCDITYIPDDMDLNFVRKVVWQTLMYINIEITSIVEGKGKKAVVCNYLKLLEQLFNFVHLFDEGSEACELNKHDVDRKKTDIIDDILNHPVILKLFVKTECLSTSKKELLKECVNLCTTLVLNIADKGLNNQLMQKSVKNLISFKNKLFTSNLFKIDPTLNANYVCTDIDFSSIVVPFSIFLSTSDTVQLFEDLLSNQVKTEDTSYCNLLLLLNLYINQAKFVFLSSKCIASLFSKYIELPKKHRKILREQLLEMLKRHPSFGSFIDNDTCCQLLKIRSKELAILGFLIDCNESIRQLMQVDITHNVLQYQSSDFLFLISKCIIKSVKVETRSESDSSFLENITLPFWDELTTYLLAKEPSSKSMLEARTISIAVEIMIKENYLSLKKVKKFFKLIMGSNDMLSVPDASKIAIFLPLLEAWKKYLLETGKTVLPIIKISLQWLSESVSKAQTSAEFQSFQLVDFLQENLKEISEMSFAEAVDLENLFTKILKFAMKYEEIGKDLVTVLAHMCDKSKDLELPVHTLYNLVMGHSKFFDIMLTKKEGSMKENIITLLISLVKLDGEVCEENHLGLFLASYGATMSIADQKMLCLIKLYSDNGVDMSKFRPFLWGKSAITHYSIKNKGSMYLWKQPKLQDILDIFISAKIDTTILHYPLEVELLPSVHIVNNMYKENICPENIYDLRFLLPLFSNLLSPGSYVHIQSFVNSRVLMLIFTSLSCSDSKTRALGYYCLSQFYHHLESLHAREKTIWMCLLDSVRNSITTLNPRIPSIVTLFLAKVVQIFVKPENSLYKILYKFIMCKPTLDVGQVPEFYVLFNSIEIEYRMQRLWLLNLLAKGLRTGLDFHICERRHIFSTLLSLYTSTISTNQEKLAILHVLTSAVKIVSTARTLCQNSLLSWLHEISVTKDLTDLEILKCICSLMQKLWITIQNKCTFQKKLLDSGNLTVELNAISVNDSDRTLMYISFPHEFLLLLLSFLKNAKTLDIESLQIFLQTLDSVLLFVLNTKQHLTSNSGLTLHHAMHIFDVWNDWALKLQRIEDSGNSVDALAIKDCLIIFTKLILKWLPSCSEIRDDNHDNQALYVFKILELILQCEVKTELFMFDVPTWLQKCFHEDKQHRIIHFIFSDKGEECLKLILQQFEKSMNCEINTSRENISIMSRAVHKTSWTEILLYLRDLSKCIGLNTECEYFYDISSLSI